MAGIPRKPLSLRNSRSISLRFLYRARSYSQDSMPLDLGKIIGTTTRSSISCNVLVPSQTPSISMGGFSRLLGSCHGNLHPSGTSCELPGDRAKALAVRASAAAICTLVCYPPWLRPMACGAFFKVPGTTGCTLIKVESLKILASG